MSGSSWTTSYATCWTRLFTWTTRPRFRVFELRTKARRLVREHGVKLIIIDYLQLMNASGMSYGNRQEEVSTILALA